MFINVKVISGAKEVKVIKIGERNYKIKLTAKRERGKANKQLVEVLARHFDKAKKSIVISQGLRSNFKQVKIKDEK